MENSQDGAKLAVLRSEVRQLRDEVKQLSSETRALVDAWTAATGLLRFVKVVSTLVAALGVIYFFLTHGFTKAP